MMKKKFIFCKTPALFIFKLCLTQLEVNLDIFKKTLSKEESENSLKEALTLYKQYLLYLRGLEKDESYIDKSRSWLAHHPKVLFAQIEFLKNVITKLESQTDDNLNREQEKAWIMLPSILGFNWDVYRHPYENPHPYPSLLFSEDDAKSVKEKMQLMDFNKETLLDKLIHSNNVKGLNEFLDNLRLLPLQDQNIILNHRDGNGKTALMWACALNHPDIVSKLLQAGADVNLIDKKGNSALLQACVHDHTPIAIELLKAGANPNQANEERLTPLQASAIKNQNLALIKILLQYKTDVNYVYNERVTVFNYFCHSEDNKVNNQIFSALLPYANPNTLDLKNQPVIFYLIMTRNSERVEALLKWGADPNVKLSQNSSFMNCSAITLAACHYRDPTIVQLLLNHGAKLEKDELNDLMEKPLLPSIKLFIQFPCTAKGTTKLEQLQLLFDDYANPPLIGGFFPTTWRHYKNYAQEISDELKKPVNKNLSDMQIRKFIEDKLSQIPGGRTNLKEGEFKNRIDLVLDHLLMGSSLLTTALNNEPAKIENTDQKLKKD